jgi:hypothetical protein
MFQNISRASCGQRLSIWGHNWTKATNGWKHYDKRMVSYRQTGRLFTTIKKGCLTNFDDTSYREEWNAVSRGTKRRIVDNGMLFVHNGGLLGNKAWLLETISRLTRRSLKGIEPVAQRRWARASRALRRRQHKIKVLDGHLDFRKWGFFAKTPQHLPS